MDITEDIVENSLYRVVDAKQEHIFDVKKLIEERYKRMEMNDRRPSIEYVSIDDIKTVFIKYNISHDKLNEAEIRTVYEEWIKDVLKKGR
jgi:hypothetical protein